MQLHVSLYLYVFYQAKSGNGYLLAWMSIALNFGTTVPHYLFFSLPFTEYYMSTAVKPLWEGRSEGGKNEAYKISTNAHVNHFDAETEASRGMVMNKPRPNAFSNELLGVTAVFVA